jgi:hypothetical protein
MGDCPAKIWIQWLGPQPPIPQVHFPSNNLHRKNIYPTFGNGKKYFIDKLREPSNTPKNFQTLEVSNTQMKVESTWRLIGVKNQGMGGKYKKSKKASKWNNEWQSQMLTTHPPT